MELTSFLNDEPIYEKTEKDRFVFCVRWVYNESIRFKIKFSRQLLVQILPPYRNPSSIFRDETCDRTGEWRDNRSDLTVMRSLPALSAKNAYEYKSTDVPTI
jgi:hypothetical protein